MVCNPSLGQYRPSQEEKTAGKTDGLGYQFLLVVRLNASSCMKL